MVFKRKRILQDPDLFVKVWQERPWLLTSCFLYLMTPGGVMMPGGSYLSARFASDT